jgi:hypothetical protein
MELFRFPDKLTLHPRMTSKSQISTASARVAGTLPRFWRPCPLFRPRLAPTASLQGVGLVEALSSQEAAAIRSGPQFPFSFQLRLSLGKLSATNSIAFRVLLRAFQASDLTRLSSLNSTCNWPVLDGGWTVLKPIGWLLLTECFADFTCAADGKGYGAVLEPVKAHEVEILTNLNNKLIDFVERNKTAK